VRARLMNWNDLDSRQVVVILGIAGSVLTGLVVTITKAKTLLGYYKEFDTMRRKRFALRQQPHCQVVCPAPLAMVEVSEKLEKISNQLLHNTKMTLDISSDRLIQKATHFISTGYMPEFEKTIMLKMFINYYFAGGNGHAMYMVDKAIKLPDRQGGANCDVDLSYILETESNKWNKKEE
jgi:hypothetical protein